MAMAVFLCPAGLHAEDVADARDEGDIVVTGSKLGQDAQDAARSIQVLYRGTLAGRGIADLAGLTKAVPGLNFAQSTYGMPIYSIRGIGYADSALTASPAVSVYVDEAPLPYAAMSVGAALDMARVEVAKGPQGILFGQNSTGGAINYVSARPTRSFAAGLTTGIASYGQVTSDAYVSGPVATGLGMRLAVRYDRGGDWQTSETRRSHRGGKDLLMGRLLTAWAPTPDLDILVNLNGWRDRSDTVAGQLVVLRGAVPPLPSGVASHPVGVRGNRHADWSEGQDFARNSDFYQGAVRAIYRVGAVTITSISAWQHLRRDDTADSDGTQFELLHSRTPGRASIFSQELRAAGAWKALNWMVGGNYQREHMHDELVLSIADSSFPFDAIDTKTSHRNRSQALFGNAELALGSGISLEGGIRYTDERRGFTGCSYDGGDGTLAAYVARVASALSGMKVVIPAGGCVSLSNRLVPAIVETSLRDRNWSWRAGAKWTVAPGAIVYGNVSRGQKSGAFPTVAATAGSQFAPATPESVLAYELGAKVTGMDGRLRLSAAGFYYDYRDKQIRGKTVDPRIGPLGALVNIPRSHIWGGEFELEVEPVAGLALKGGASLVRSTIEGAFINYDAYGRLRNLGGEDFPLTPRWQLIGDAAYRWAIGRGTSEAFIGASVKYQSTSFADLGDISALRLNPYATIDLRAGARIDDRWTVQAYVSNLADQHYGTYVGTVSPDVTVRFTGAPRIIGMRVGVEI